MKILFVAVAITIGLLAGYLGNRLNERLERPILMEELPAATAPTWAFPVTSAILFGLLAWTQGATSAMAIHAFWVWLLLLIAAFDLRWHLILDVVTYPAVVAALILATATGSPGLMDSLLGLGLGLACLLPFAVISELFHGGGGFGWGDVKLGALLGAILGASLHTYQFNGVAAICYGAILGGVVTAALLLTRSLGWRQAIAYGPFLAAGGILVIFIG